MGAVLGKIHGSHDVQGDFRRVENRVVGRLLRGPEGERDYQGVEDRAGCERRKVILLYRATEQGVDPASH